MSDRTAAQQLKDLIEKLAPSWNTKGDLAICGELTPELHRLLEKANEIKLLEKVQIQGELIARTFGSLNEKMYGKKTVICTLNTKANTVCPIYCSVESVAEDKPVLPPETFLVFEDCHKCAIRDASDDSNATGKLKHYLEIASLWQILKKNAEDSSSVSVTFLYRKKMKLLAKYDTSLLKNEYGGLARFKRVLAELSSESHIDAKPHILQNCLVSFLYNTKEVDRFNNLLTYFDKFTSKFDDAYHAYVVGFSFDDLRKEYEEKYREYMVKINDLLSSTLTKALMIPGALYLTATRTQSINAGKNIEQGLELAIVNFGIAVAAITIFTVYAFVLDSEKKSLVAIEDEFSSLMSRLEDKSPTAAETISTYRDNIKSRITLVKEVFTTLTFLNIAMGITSILWTAARFLPEGYLS
ncbi:hypothetical protein A1OK_10815 [Enterovibrio norvegicus FF-454]|uniref:Uncharacterized protein n=1 Tax=Enterovibrio norvegicus FF-454 TaxID=1185651 RepID=A0A1E5C4I8_9GAMM|nr:hypothetical protein [Enterovibrio norvegicus]OEE60434.1 hypothetical protein A1OK_10815 [Enterovibrio norvegicus FF-454]